MPYSSAVTGVPVQQQQHARAVREAISTARAANEHWRAMEDQPVAPAPAPTDAMAEPAPGGIGAGAGAKRATYTHVSPQEVMIGLRIGTKLIVIDADDNKHSDLVRAIEALLTRAKKMVDTNGRQRVSIATEVAHQPDTRVAIDVVPTAKGSETTMHYEQGVTRERIYPIGVVDFFLG